MSFIKLNVLLIILTVVNSYTYLNFTELAHINGYASEEHTVITEDGYVLTLFRILKGAKCNVKNKQTPVFFMPPLLAAADTALEAGPNAALPYLISDACFDIWVGNPRGTYYGRDHLTIDPDKDKEFWNFSVDEIGAYDIPAMIEYVLEFTRKEKLMYVGFSQGGGTFFIMCSERPDICQRIKLMIGLAPATRLWNTRSVLTRILFQNVENFWNVCDNLNIWELFGRDLAPAIMNVMLICRNSPKLCEWLSSIADSPHPGSVAISTFKTFLQRFPAGTSVKNMVWYSQGGKSKKFKKFDYGIEKNLEIYSQPYPPEYNLTAADLPILLMAGRNDNIVDIRDVKWLASRLPNVIEFVVVQDPLWNHVDMFYSQLIKGTIFPKILYYLLNYNDL